MIESTNGTTAHQVAGMSFDAERLAARKKTLGASEIGAVVGLNPHRTALDVYLDKKGLVAPFEGNEFTEWGLRLENVVAEKYAELQGARLVTSDTLVASLEPWASATPDRLVMGEQASWGLECKNKGARQIMYWGETGGDQIPHDIAAQVHWSMYVTGFKWWDVAVLFGGNQFRHYRIHRNEEILGALVDQGREFWYNHVLADVEPAIDGSKSAAEYLNKKFSSHTELVREADHTEGRWINDLATARQERDAVETRVERLTNILKGAIGDGAGMMSKYGRVTWKAPKPTELTDWEGLARSLAVDIAGESIGETTATDVIADRLPQFTTLRNNTRRFLFTAPKE